MAPTATLTNTQHMYLTLRASAQAAPKCYASMVALAAKHATVPVDLAGVTLVEDEFLLTLDVNLGASDRIAEPSEEATAGYAFVVALCEDLFEFLPNYSSEPDAEARALAEAFESRFTATARIAV